MSNHCPICASNAPKTSFTVKEMYYGLKEEFEYSECNSCGLLYLGNPPQNMSLYYPENYHCHRVGFLRKYTPKAFLANYRNRMFVLHKKDSISDYLEKKSPTPLLIQLFSKTNPSLDSKILDVGCGSGEFLFQLEQIGFKNLSGMDPFLPDDIFKVKSRVVFYKKSLKDTRGRYDIITLNHVFEHMDKPEEVLSLLKLLLKQRGKIMIRIPVKGGWAWDEFKENWYQIDAPRHLFLYTLKSFEALAEKSGLIINDITYDSNVTQFTRSALYQKGITSTEFLSHDQGKLEKYFDAEQLNVWKQKTIEGNNSQKGDQACFILSIKN